MAAVIIAQAIREKHDKETNEDLADVPSRDSIAVDIEKKEVTVVDFDMSPTTSSIRNSFPVDMVFKNISAYFEKKDAKTKAKSTQHILNQVSAFIRPASFTALMGPSGCGKTTLLNILAGKADMKWDGEILVNGKPRHKDFSRKIGYVTQDDLMLERLTVREQLIFNARLRLPEKLDKKEKIRRVEDVIDAMGLRACEDTKIGGPRQRGVSGGERKRTAIASEMLINPSVLFLDEPTSGLDAYTALSVMESLRNAAKDHHRTVISSIHQPRSDIFSLFDNVILISAGEIVYFGPGGDTMISWFASHGHPCPAFTNPADFFIDLITRDNAERLKAGRAGIRGDTETDRLIAAFQREQLSIKVVDSPDSFTIPSKKSRKSERIPGTVEQTLVSADTGAAVLLDRNETAAALGYSEGSETKMYAYPVGWWAQYVAMVQRAWLSNIRDPMATIARAMQSIVLGAIIGTIFLRMGLDQQDVQNRLGSLFLMLTLLAFLPALSVVTSFPSERPVYKKEARSGMYRTSAYYFGKLTAEVPLWILFPIIQGTICYFMFGYQAQFDNWIIFIVACVLSALVGISIAICISCLVPNFEAANSAIPPVFVLLFIFGGFFLNASSIPKYYIWIQYISQFFYAFEIITVNEFTGLVFNCTPTDCAYPNGESVISAQGFSSQNTGRNFGILAALIVFYQSAAFFMLYRQGRNRNM